MSQFYGRLSGAGHRCSCRTGHKTTGLTVETMVVKDSGAGIDLVWEWNEKAQASVAVISAYSASGKRVWQEAHVYDCAGEWVGMSMGTAGRQHLEIAAQRARRPKDEEVGRLQEELRRMKEVERHEEADVGSGG